MIRMDTPDLGIRGIWRLPRPSGFPFPGRITNTWWNRSSGPRMNAPGPVRGSRGVTPSHLPRRRALHILLRHRCARDVVSQTLQVLRSVGPIRGPACTERPECTPVSRLSRSSSDKRSTRVRCLVRRTGPEHLDRRPTTRCPPDLRRDPRPSHLDGQQDSRPDGNGRRPERSPSPSMPDIMGLRRPRGGSVRAPQRAGARGGAQAGSRR